jgi:hypothetical protein
MTIHNYIGGVFYVAVGLYVCIGAYKLGFGTFQEPGPGFIFIFCGSLLTILSVADLLKTFLEKSRSSGTMWAGLKWPKVVLVLVALFASVYFFELLGFPLSTFLLMLFLLNAVEPAKWWITLVSSLIIAFAAYIIFDHWLRIPFPQGFLGI